MTSKFIDRETKGIPQTNFYSNDNIVFLEINKEYIRVCLSGVFSVYVENYCLNISKISLFDF